MSTVVTTVLTSPASWMRSLSRTARERRDWVPLDTPLGQALRVMRWVAVTAYVVVLVYVWKTNGIPFGRSDLLIWLAIGLVCASIGRHPAWLLLLIIDFLPLALVLAAYDQLRGFADDLGMPTHWTYPIEVDKFLFFGQVPTVWLQEHLKHQRFVGVQWYDIVVTLTYYSFFFLPYVTAAWLWLRRGRAEFYRWVGRFVGLSFLGYTFFVLIPTAPPWAADHCTAADVASHPSDPSCMYEIGLKSDAIMPPFTTHQVGAAPWVERIVGDGFHKLNIEAAHTVWIRGAASADKVAAVPSLHVATTVLFAIFMWSRIARWAQPILVVYPMVMMFSLAYGGEHYVADGIAGALCAWFVSWAATAIESRWKRRRRSDEKQPDQSLVELVETTE
jgi:hypothetical protein